MKKCIVIPDSFKGTMSSQEVCDIISSALREIFPDCQICKIPIADGGEGTVDCFLHALSGEKVHTRVHDPFGNIIESFYGRIGDTAVIETAAAAGLSLTRGKRNPGAASTYGVGELVHHAVSHGAKKIILGLGGSGTNDGGAGMAAAAGTKFYRKDGSAFVPVGDTLNEVYKIDNRDTELLLRGIEITAMCDIQNTMFGKNGAAYVFGPQKGAEEKDVELLDANLRIFANVIYENLGLTVSTIAGGGAAGAMGAGVYAFFGGKLTSGIDVLLETVGYDSLLPGCDAVFTGEGKLDSQSFGGKVIDGVARHSRKFGVPVIAVAGYIESGTKELFPLYGISDGISIYDRKVDIRQILPTCKNDLRNAVLQRYI